MDEALLLYDDTEHTTSRFVGFAGNHARYDVVITTTDHFYGKHLVYVIQNGRTAIMDDNDAIDIPLLMDAFQIHSEAEADEFSQFLIANL
ncbi:DUF3055 family protein [Alicyclobacillaceae bacterium I2511]|nr:DUF3055 family protein [Alicyclobacillaceae bacterium I2511]